MNLKQKRKSKEHGEQNQKSQKGGNHIQEKYLKKQGTYLESMKNEKTRETEKEPQQLKESGQ